MLEQPSTSMHQRPTAHAISSGRSGRKSRGGCGTCKARRVKCDETKPVCSRCLTTGRTCDGYGVLGGGGNTYLERYGRLAQSTQPLSCVPLSKPLARSFLPEELRYIRLYKQHASWTSSGWFGYPFWHATVLPALVSEPAILHAVVALSAAHPWDLYPKQNPDGRDRFIVKQYSKAICALQPLSSRYGDSKDIAVVLVTCMLFTFLEYSRGRYEVAETHLENGIRLLGEGVPGIEKGIVRSFVALVTQRSLFATHDDDDINNTDFVLFLNPKKDVLLPGSTFDSPEDAKYALDIILRRVTRAEQLVQQRRTHSLSLEHEQGELNSLLSSWHTIYLRTISRIKASPTTPDSLAFGTHSAASTSRETMSYTLLLLYHTLSLIKLSALLSPSEAIYRTQTPLFLRIISCAAQLYTAYSLAAAIPQNVNLHDSVSESGFIAPLYYTGLKCRVGRVRRYVYKYLRVIPHKECGWDSILAANVLRRVMRLEEGKQENRGEEEGEEEIDLSEVPVLDKAEEEQLGKQDVRALFRSVKLEMLPGEGTRAKVVCERLGRDGNVELVEFMVDNK